MIFAATTMDIVDDYEERTTDTMANAVLHEWEVTYPNSDNGIQTLVTKMDFEQTTTNEKTCIQGSDADTLEEENEKTKKKPYKPRGTYCKYMPEQMQGRFELVIENGWTAKMATKKWALMFVLTKTILPSIEKIKNNVFLENNVAETIQKARTALLEKFKDLMITLSGLQKHLVIQLRKDKVTEWLFNLDFDYVRDCVFIDETGFNMHIKCNFRRSTHGKPAKTTVSMQQGVNITILEAISQIGVISVTLCKPQAVVSSKKLKLDKKVEKINGHVGI
ncbi:hypothetical protein J3Q64DRAFT_1833883 [Phycomyces blakesleeanus]|uniref:Uncharacterized protein n=2 Tax=Phycomyces blakesleeanus TaxID=4837 RepID=A0A162TUE8_PHYB8|nr:hypothetical protein PHYBLDRAFT_148299 [Phycomyces blakesleeanus NRRL 1555(-)]OAD71082.1 hypothetical protein PHYBLDRAFT_148299 [Phycomyces blakesleeanus NRRL 1555(-)]|eukprot:XP_018289122.1 hypothetical protein PHYBLDRAFT_148299 [Phycomyces blakesleeanus NRRL 1555(-)]